jgi:RNA-directed DNA polymerase
MVLDGLEKRLGERFPQAKRKGLKMHMVRYADDFIITGHSKEWLENEVKSVVAEFLAERGLALSSEKTKITHITEGFDFLGWNIRKYNGKLLIKPSKASITAHCAKIREIIKTNKTAKQVNLIKQLNPLLRGWANYHRHMVAKKVFARIDHYKWSMLWQWAKRRHPNKGARWIKEKYFKIHGTRKWVFATTEGNGQRGSILLTMADTPIIRHIKIQSTANPYDPKWETYFKIRTEKKRVEKVSKYDLDYPTL